MNAMIPIVAKPGDIIGIAMRWKIYNSFAPSIRAASISAGGITESTYCLKKKTVPGAAIAGNIKGGMNSRDAVWCISCKNQ